MDNLELKVEKEDVKDFFRNTVPTVIKRLEEQKRSDEFNFYINSVTVSIGYSDLKGLNSEFLKEYRNEIEYLDKHFWAENKLFLGLMKDIRQGKDVSKKAEGLFNLYDIVINRVNKIKAIYDESKYKPQYVEKLLNSVTDWATARENMYNPQIRDAYLAPFLLLQKD